MKVRRGCLLATVLLACLAGGLYVGRHAWLPGLGTWLDVGVLAARADYLLVLGGSAETRAVGAATMYRAGLTKHILISETALHLSARDGILPSESDLTRRVLIARGVPDEAIIGLGRENDNTYDEVRALGEFLDKTPQTSVGIVTSDFHTRRTRWIAQLVLGPRIQRVPIVSVPNDNCPLSVWWRTDRGFIMVMSEYLKLTLYAVRYSRVVQVVLGMCAVLFLAWIVLRRRSRTAAQ